MENVLDNFFQFFCSAPSAVTDVAIFIPFHICWHHDVFPICTQLCFHGNNNLRKVTLHIASLSKTLDTMSDFFQKSYASKSSSIFVCLHNLYRFLWIIQLCSGGPWTKISAICEYKASDNWRYLLPIAEIADTTKSAYLEPQTCATNLKKHISF